MTEVEKLKQEIEVATTSLTAKIELLKTQSQKLLSPTEQIQEHPLLCMGLALGAGLVVGSQLTNSRKILEPLAVGILTNVVEELGKKYFPEGV